jgi:plastocyanin
MQPARSIRLLALTAVALLGLAACTASAAPGWTFAPTPSPSAAPSVAPSASAGGSAAPSAAPSGSSAPSAAPSGGGAGGTTLQQVASGVQFGTASLEAPANQPFSIDFDNQDAGIPHNIQIADASGTMVFEGDTVNGPAKITYNVPALAAGSYKFSCKWHPTMVGDLTVK